MTKLNQILAIEKGVKAKTAEALNQVYHNFQKPELLEGLVRTYAPKTETDEKLPGETKKVQVSVTESLKQLRTEIVRLFDVTAEKEFTNCTAKADVVVDGKKLLEQVPATYLLFLEKQLVDWQTLIKKLPVLSSAENWAYDPAKSLWKSEPVMTVRTKKIPKNHEMAPATEKHPAQVQVYMEDVPQGEWTVTKLSGARPKDEVTAMLDRVEMLLKSVRFAREEANNAQVSGFKAGDAVWDFVFGGK